jgi:hypothetical protein
LDQEEILMRDVPLSNYVIAALPALYGLQLYGWGWALLVFAAVVIPLAVVGWLLMFEKVSTRTWRICRFTFPALGFVALALSAMEFCQGGTCARVLQ